METPLDVLSRAASFVHANEEEEGKWGCVVAAQVYDKPLRNFYANLQRDKVQFSLAAGQKASL